MWMMGYNDGGDSFSGRKLRAIVPRPAAVINPSCLGRIHGTDHLLSFNHHLAGLTEQSKRDFSQPQVIASSRWNPTPEQLQTLEELYRRGTRTPSAEEIQRITAQLRKYGKIEGKNVFYWFQNHKARERQKRRRQLESKSDELAHDSRSDIENTEKKESGGVNVTGIEVERTKTWASSTHCTTLAENTVPLQRAAKAAIPECRAADRWVQFDDAELQQRRSLEERNATWHMMQFPCSSSSSSSFPTNNIIYSTTCATTINPPTSSRTMDLKHTIKSHEDQNIFVTAYGEEFDHNHLVSGSSNIIIHGASNYDSGENDQTLQLFPLRSNQKGDQDSNQDVADEESVAEINTTTVTPCKFFEFLPLKH